MELPLLRHRVTKKVFVKEVKNRDWRLQQTIRAGDYKHIDGDGAEAAPAVYNGR